MSVTELADRWHKLFNRYASDLYPGRYTREKCRELAEQAIEIQRLAREKQSTIVVHNYLYPELHEIAQKVGDSLGLSFYVRDQKAARVDFESVFFMGATAKIITGDATRVFMPDSPDVLGCSLVFGTDHIWLERWKVKHPDGLLITYINSDAYTKAISDFISTSRNTHKIIAYALKNFPNRRILVLPDKYLGLVMKNKALDLLRNEGFKITTEFIDRIEIYEHSYQGNNASCYVHEQIGPNAAEVALLQNQDAELMIHPECGCAASCLMKLEAGIIPRGRAYFLSTEQMVEQAKFSEAKRFIVATEKGMIYRLRKELPEKEFIPVSMQAECKYMKANSLEKLLESLRRDRLEIRLCNDCCDPKHPHQDDQAVHIQKSVAQKAKVAIERMLAIQ